MNMPKERLKIIPGLYLVPIKDGKVLLLRRFNTGWADGQYSLVGGHLDADENYKNAMIREAKEESGLELDADALKVVHVLHRNQDGNRIDLFFQCENWQGEPTITEPDKCDEIAWFALDNLPANTIPYISQALENIQKKVFYSDFGF